jgi:hypothetical protein
MASFNEAELVHARKKYGLIKKCPKCTRMGRIDADFGWRRMRREDTEIKPQAQCYDCREVSWKK